MDYMSTQEGGRARDEMLRMKLLLEGPIHRMNVQVVFNEMIWAGVLVTLSHFYDARTL